MRANSRVPRSLWRWRRNPLRRCEDVVEGWLVLAAWLVVAVGGPWAGAMSAQATEETLARQGAERQSVTATLVTDAADSGGDRAEPAGERVFVTVRWTAPDGTLHIGRARVDAGTTAGERAVVWTDRQDRIKPRPLTPVQAEFQAVIMGVTASLALAGTAAGGYRMARANLDRRRHRAWDAEWQEVGCR